MFPKYLSLDHMWHRRIGLSEAGNDFFVLISALRGITVVLVIRPFITLPACYSAVWVNAISPDPHNYPKIERGREIFLALVLWVRKSLGIYTGKERKKPEPFSNQPSRLNAHKGCSSEYWQYAWCLYPRKRKHNNICQRHSSICCFPDRIA